MPHDKPYSHASSPVTAATPVLGTPAASTPARRLTEPLRELSSLALLVANGVFLFLGLSGLFLVLRGWASEFGLRSAAAFGSFAGPLALGLPMLALLLGTHVAPMARRSRLIMIGVLVEYGVSAVFAAVTFLGAFAFDLSRGARETLEGLLERVTWLALLVLAIVIAVRVWLGLFPSKGPLAHHAQHRPTYGKPYPGQPMYPQLAVPAPAQPGSPQAAATPATVPAAVGPAGAPAATGAAGPGSPSPMPAGSAMPGASGMSAASITSWAPAVPGASASPASAAGAGAASVEPDSGWPVVPPPPMPAPLIIDADPTVWVRPPAQVGPDTAGDATQAVPPPDAAAPAELDEPPTEPIGPAPSR